MIKKIITPILGFFPLLIAVLLPFFSGGEDPLIKLFSILLISFSLLLFTLFSGLKWLRDNSFFSARVILGLFLLFSFLSSIFSHNVFFSLLCWLEFLLGALIFFTLQKQEFWQNKKYSILAVIVSSSTLLSLLGFFYYLVGNYTRLTSTFYWPNPFASFLLLILPLNIYLLWQGRYKLIWLLFLIINGSAFVLTGSRGAWLSLILVLVGLAIIAWRQKEFFVPKKNIFNILKIFILIVILAFVLQGLKDNNWSFIQRNYQGPLDSSSVMRLDYWLGAGKIFISNPFLGTGLGSFKTVYQYYQSNPLSSGKYAHNWYLELLAEGGILVFLSFLAFILLVLRPQNKMTENPFSWFILISLSSYLLHNGVDIGSHYFANQILFWLLLTWYISINIKIEKKENINLFIPRFIPVIILGLTTIFIVLICFTALIGQRANQLEELAKQANTSFEQNSLLLEAAENYQFASLMIRSDYLRQSGIDFYVLALREQDRTSELLNQALPLAEKLVRLDSNNALSYELLGKILLAQGKIDLAKDNFVKAVALSPFIPRNYINLSSVLVIQKDREQAKKVIERILSYYPDEITEIREMRIMPNQQILSGISEDIKMLKQLRAELDKAN